MVVHNWVHIEDGESKMTQVTCWCACVCFEAETQKMDARVLIIDGSSSEVDYISESAGLATWQTRPSPCLGIQFGGCRWIQPWYTVTWYNHENHHELLHKLGYTSEKSEKRLATRDAVVCFASVSGQCSLCSQIPGHPCGCLVCWPMCFLFAPASLHFGRGQTCFTFSTLSTDQRMLVQISPFLTQVWRFDSPWNEAPAHSQVS